MRKTIPFDFRSEIGALRCRCNHSELQMRLPWHGEKLRHTRGVRRACRRGSAFSQDFSRAFDISRLEIELDDDTTIDFEDAMEAAVAYWVGFFFRHQLA